MRVTFIILSFLFAGNCFAKTIVAGASQQVKTLKQAISLAKDKDSILLQPGVYREENIILTRSVTIIGNNAVLDGQNKFEILTISGKNITVKGIQFINAGYSSMNDFAAIKIVDAANVIIDNNTITNAYFAIHISNSSYCTISNNKISGTPKTEQSTGNGIHLWKCNRTTIKNNTISGQRDGIYFEFVTSSTIENNFSEKNIRYGLHFMYSNENTYLNNTFRNNGAGVAVMYSKKVNMQFNHFEENWGPSSYGILLKDISDSYIGQNTFRKNTVGIYMEGTSRIELQKNVFKENGWAMKVQASCNENSFHHNNYYNNSFDIATNGTMVLNKFYNNYWDKYDGYDMNKDGIGDIPYHPVSMYSMIVEQNPTAVLLMRSFTIALLDKAEKAIPLLTPADLLDDKPMIKPNKL